MVCAGEEFDPQPVFAGMQCLLSSPVGGSDCMEPYLISLGAGVLTGMIYSALKVRSPAPPLVALVGLLGMLIGAQAVPSLKPLFGF
jgi:XapX domain-containing protein